MALSLIMEDNDLKYEIELLRKKLHDAIKNNESKEKILSISEQLDKLISLYHKIYKNKKG